MMLAGIPVADRDVLELTRRLRASGFLDTAETSSSRTTRSAAPWR
jgi:hypothetical protein